MNELKSLGGCLAWVFVILIQVTSVLLISPKAYAEIRIAYAWANNATATPYCLAVGYAKFDDRDMTCAAVRGEKPLSNFVSASEYGPIGVTLNQKLYSFGDQIQAQLDLGGTFTSSDLEGVLLVLVETGNIEHLVMRRVSGSVFKDGADSVVRIERDTVANKFDGKLSAQPGERIIALFYPDPSRHKISAEAGIIADFSQSVTYL